MLPTPDRVGQSASFWYLWFAVEEISGRREFRVRIVPRS